VTSTAEYHRRMQAARAALAGLDSEGEPMPHQAPHPPPPTSGLVPISFSGASDDLIYLRVPDGYAEQIEQIVPDDDPNTTDLREVSVLRYGGWVIDQPDYGKFCVWAHYNGSWSFSVGHHLGSDLEPDWEFRPMPAVARQDPGCSYSSELTVWVQPGTSVSLTTEGAHDS
jgi:hypothetical protein